MSRPVTQRLHIRDLVIEQYPKVVMVEARNAQDVMALVASGEADAGVNSLIIARYRISHQYRNQLRITSTVGTQQARTAFAPPWLLGIVFNLGKSLAKHPFGRVG